MTNIFMVERTDDEGRTTTYPSVFTDEASARSLVEALNTVLPESPSDYADNLWAVAPLTLDGSYGEVYIPEFYVQISCSPLMSDYAPSCVYLSKAVLAGTPVTATTIAEPTANWPWWNVHVYGRSIEEVREAGDIIALGLNTTSPVSNDVSAWSND